MCAGIRPACLALLPGVLLNNGQGSPGSNAGSDSPGNREGSVPSGLGGNGRNYGGRNPPRY